MEARATAKIRINATKEIIKTLKVYSKGLQFCVNTAWKKKIRNNIKLHPFVYKSLRKRGLQSQLAIACIKQACGMVKKAKTKPIIKQTSMRYNFPRSASFKNNILSLATIKGRVKIPFTIPDCYRQYFTWKVTESLLRIDKKCRCFFLFTFSKDVDIDSSCFQNRVLGIDVGVNNLAVTSDGKFYRSPKIKRVKRKFKHLRSKLQAKGTRSAKRLLKKISGREKRFMAWVNHNISKDVVSNFDGNKIVMEDIKGISKENKRKGRIFNWVLSNWSFYQLQRFIQYKAERKGIEIINVNPYMTSQICHRCGKIGSRSKGCFSCSHCGLSNFNADLNASRNLAHPKLVERQVAITPPYSLCDDSKASNSGTADEHKAKSPRL